MRDVLEHSTDILLSRLLPQQQILYLRHCTLIALIGEVIPSARVTVQQSRRLDHLPAVFAALALERVVCVTCRTGPILEQLTQRVEAEMAFDILSRVDDAR